MDEIVGGWHPEFRIHKEKLLSSHMFFKELIQRIEALTSALFVVRNVMEQKKRQCKYRNISYSAKHSVISVDTEDLCKKNKNIGRYDNTDSVPDHP